MTAIAAICRTGEIVLAADSRRLGLVSGEQSSVCKIRDLKTLYAVLSGINTYDPTHFDVSQLIPAQMPDVDIGTNVNSIADAIFPPLRDALEHLRNENPGLFASTAVQKHPMDIKFARVQNCVPTLITLRAVVQISESGPPTVIPERHDWPIWGMFDTPACSFVGTDEGVATYLALSDNGELYKGDLVERARSFVQTEIDKHATGIGGPIDILRLTKEGANWIQRKDGC
jgi:hypothetical protein